jgi:AraC-like DNA-binding protein
MSADPTPAGADSSGLLSRQVSGSRYFFLNLAPGGGARPLAMGGCEHCDPDYAIDRHAYAYHVLEYVAEGAGTVGFGGSDWELGPGSVFAYLSTTPCRIRTDPQRPMVKYFLAFGGRGIPGRLARAGIAPRTVRVLAAHGEIRGVFETIIREGRGTGPRAADLCAALVEVLLLRLAQVAEEGAPRADASRERFLRAKALIEERAERLSSLGDIASAAGMDGSSLCRLFRRFEGTSPYRYLLRRKMNLAAEILIEGGGPVKEAARRVGFSDPYHFSRCFKAVHGVSPRDLRRGGRCLTS